MGVPKDNMHTASKLFFRQGGMHQVFSSIARKALVQVKEHTKKLLKVYTGTPWDSSWPWR